LIRLNLSPRECAANEPAEMDPFALDHIPGTIALEQLPWNNCPGSFAWSIRPGPNHSAFNLEQARINPHMRDNTRHITQHNDRCPFQMPEEGIFTPCRPH